MNMNEINQYFKIIKNNKSKLYCCNREYKKLNGGEEVFFDKYSFWVATTLGYYLAREVRCLIDVCMFCGPREIPKSSNFWNALPGSTSWRRARCLRDFICSKNVFFGYIATAWGRI